MTNQNYCINHKPITTKCPGNSQKDFSNYSTSNRWHSKFKPVNSTTSVISTELCSKRVSIYSTYESSKTSVRFDTKTGGNHLTIHAVINLLFVNLKPYFKTFIEKVCYCLVVVWVDVRIFKIIPNFRINLKVERAKSM